MAGLILVAQTAAGAERITSVRVENGRLALGWSSTNGLFQVQQSVSLSPAEWVDAGRITLATTNSVPVAETFGFFRVKAVPVANPVVFNGGNLAQLRALNAELQFDDLVIAGPLELGLGEDTQITAGNFFLTEGGSIGYDKGACDHGAAPDLTIVARGQVVLDGPVLLMGESGTRTTHSATCNSCSGYAGGSLDIQAGEIVVRSRVDTRGGAGSTIGDLLGSSGCSGGDSGGIQLRAANILIEDGELNCGAGSGGTGFSLGNETRGANGAPGTIEINASGLVGMRGGTVRNEGRVTLRAERTAIFGAITGGNLDVLVGGRADDERPVVEIIAPTDGGQVMLSRPLELRVRIADIGTGVREVRVTGLGHDQVHTAEEFKGGVLALRIESPAPPASLEVVARDNKGLASTNRVSVSLAGNLTIPEGVVYPLRGDLNLGPAASVQVAGTIVLPRGVHARVNADSFRLAATGKIIMEPPVTDADTTNTPSLTLELNGAAEVLGEVDLDGVEALPGHDYLRGEDGGRFDLSANHIRVSGTITADGGFGEGFRFGFPSRDQVQGRGDGGTIVLRSKTTIDARGTLSVKGGDSPNAGFFAVGCFRGGHGGSILLSHSANANLAEAILGLEPGVTGGTCADEVGSAGLLGVLRIGGEIQEVAEVEPNESALDAQELPPTNAGRLSLFYAARVSAEMRPAEAGALTLTFEDGSQNDLEDLYFMDVRAGVKFNIRLDSSGAADLDLVLMRAEGGQFEIVAEGMRSGSELVIESVTLTPAFYYLGVGAVEGLSANMPYVVNVVPLGYP